jgi:hypothetical protein
MVSAARHNELVDFLMKDDVDMDKGDFEKIIMERFGDFTFAELDKALQDAADRSRENAAVMSAEADELERFMPLFEGEGSGADRLIDVARRKAAKGNELAIEFLKWCEE